MNSSCHGTPNFYREAYRLFDGTLADINIIDPNSQIIYNREYMIYNYIRKADIAFLIYDIKNKKSFELIKDYYLGDIKKKFKKNIIITLLGNKLDYYNER